MSVKIDGDIASRNFTVNGKNFDTVSTKIKTDIVWPFGRNLTFGGREVVNNDDITIHGYITDVQVFSTKLTNEAMKNYTSCNKVFLSNKI